MSIGSRSVFAAPKVDLSAPQNVRDGVSMVQNGTVLRATWPIAAREWGVLELELAPEKPLIRALSIAANRNENATPILQNVQPQTIVTVGTRDLKPAGWNVFFDKVPSRPYQSHVTTLSKTTARVQTRGNRSTIIIGGLQAGPFNGDLRFTLIPNTRLIHSEAVISTTRDATAFLYDAGLSSAQPSWNQIRYLDNFDKWQSAQNDAAAKPIAVRHRAVMAQSAGGSLAVFPAPHKYFYPLDFAENFQFAWHGKGYNGIGDSGFGIRQPPQGDNRWVPWVNAPPNTLQRLGVFYLLSRGKAENSLQEVKRYTRGDRFKRLDGFRTFSSHFHNEHTLDVLNWQKANPNAPLPPNLQSPSFVPTFKRLGVDIVHLAEFHIGWNDQLRAQRVSMLQKLHEECARLSDAEFLLLPGEEPNEHLGGHWISLFPRPVLWNFRRGANTPFKENRSGTGTVYNVGNDRDVLGLMRETGGLMWTAHARIKASQDFPDAYRNEDFFLGDRFLGAAWKAMPSDLSQEQLGNRVLNLGNDMANWGHRKYVLGEADVFRVQPDYEMYAHMNVNYLQIPRTPRFKDGWPEIVNALRDGKFFVTTGEILIPKFSIGGKGSGDSLQVLAGRDSHLQASLEWTFPLDFAEIISGDGARVFRQRVNLGDTTAFGTRDLRVNADLQGRDWARLEVWDIAGNGAFTQPVWLDNRTNDGSSLKQNVAAASTSPATFARFVPERSDDFAWENDLVAFRTFGPALRPSTEDSGIDVWLKRVPYPVIDRWYAGEKRRQSYHEDHGEGYDAYQVGRSRGTGGTAIWHNGKMILSDTFTDWKIISQTPQKTVFELGYDYLIDNEKIRETKRITIELGQRLFQSQSTFTKNGQPAALDIAIGITTHDGKGRATLNPQSGWMSVWETIDGDGLGTGVVIAPNRIVEMREIKSQTPDESHAVAITRTDAKGQIAFHAGYGWARAGEITSAEKWQAYLQQFAVQVN